MEKKKKKKKKRLNSWSASKGPPPPPISHLIINLAPNSVGFTSRGWLEYLCLERKLTFWQSLQTGLYYKYVDCQARSPHTSDLLLFFGVFLNSAYKYLWWDLTTRQSNGRFKTKKTKNIDITYSLPPPPPPFFYLIFIYIFCLNFSPFLIFLFWDFNSILALWIKEDTMWKKVFFIMTFAWGWKTNVEEEEEEKKSGRGRCAKEGMGMCATLIKY